MSALAWVSHLHSNAAWAAASATVASFIGAISSSSIGIVEKALLHSVSQGAIAELHGGSFLDGAVGALASKMASGVGEAIFSSNGFTGIAGRTMVASSFGYIAAEATGGDGKEAAMVAAVVHLFNYERSRARGNAQEGNPAHDPKSGPYEVEVPADVKTALSITLGVDASDVGNVKVIANSRWANFLNWGNKLFGGPGIAATTLGKNRILLPSHTSPDFFFNTPSLILHEYFHVFTQWNTGQMNVFNYLINPNKWEIPAYGYGDSARNQSTYNHVRYFSQ